MVKNYLRLIAFSILLLVCSLQLTSAQDKASREALWHSYAVPSAPFKRFVSPSNSLILRVPVSWQQLGSDLHFRGENEIEFRVIIEKIPDGIGLKTYLAAMLQNLRNLPGGIESLTIRRTQIGGHEARELSFEVDDLQGTMTRRFVWMVANGAEAITFLFVTPDAKQAENLPYFKGIMQSAAIVGQRFFYDEFNYLYSKIITQNIPSPVNEVQALVARLESHNPDEREKAVVGLAKIFATSPASALDLLLDRRPFVRALTVKAMALSGNSSLNDFLVYETGDLDPFVAAQATQAVAALPDIVELIRNVDQGFLIHNDKLLRVGALLDVQTRAKVAAELFKTKSTDLSAAINFKLQVKVPPRMVAPPPPPPPPAKTTAKGKKPPRSLGVININGFKSSSNGKSKAPAVKPRGEMNAQFLALNLISEIPVHLIKIPFAEIVAQDNEQLTNLALAVAFSRRELLPVEALFKLLEVAENRSLAALNLAQAASASDIAKLETLIEKFAAKKPNNPKAVSSKKTDKQKNNSSAINSTSKKTDSFTINSTEEKKPSVTDDLAFTEELRVAIKKIQLREQVAKADKEARLALLKNALGDKQLADWLWLLYWRDETEGAYTNDLSPLRAAKLATPDAKVPQVLPLCENLFPENVTLYAALPKPGEALRKFGDSLANMQMDTAREQAQFLVMFNTLRELMMSTLGAKADDSLLDAAGIKADAPLVVGSWSAENAPRGLKTAQRSAVVARVTDRDKFERALTVYQTTLGNFANFPGYLSAVSRFIGLAPALLPYAASMMDEETPKTPKPGSSSYSLISFDECLGYPVKIIERREVEIGGTVKHDRIYVAYLQDTALLTPDWFSMRDALRRLENKGANLAANPSFKRALATDGEVIYMSDVGAAFDTFSSSPGSAGDERIMESGALKISNTAWESAYQLLFKNNDWTKPLKPFQAQELTAPRELLPKSTLVYLLSKLDATQAWQQWHKDLFTAEDLTAFQSGWAIDFEKEVLPELGDECGAALLKFPKGEQLNFNWALFFKLKSDKLGKAFHEGKLFKQANGGFARVKFGSSELVAAIKNGYLIFADSQASIEHFEAKEKLSATRDFAKAVSHAPANLVAFGGYNLEAAIEALDTSSKDPNTRAAIATLITISRAFHSQNFYATLEAQGLNAKLSVQLAREGRYSVAELSQMSKDFELAFAVVEARGLPIVDQARIDSLKMRVKAKSKGVVERIKENIESDYQKAEKQADDSLLLTLRPRHPDPKQKITLPVTGAEFAAYLKPTRQIRSDDENVTAKAREIVGEEKDAWTVGRKLSQWIYKNLQWKKVDDADAAQTLATRQADCLEFSELFIAMARSQGLPARLVTGLAHSGGSFGGHAWVEIYAGEWLELDPTWGTDYVDATHIKAESSELLSYAALNLIELETLEATRATPDYQRDATKLVEKICADFSSGTEDKAEALSLALDMKMLADHLMGAGAWDGMNEKEREQFSAKQRMLMFSLFRVFQSDEGLPGNIRILKTRLVGDGAEVLALHGAYRFNEKLLKFKLARKGDAWVLLEIVQADSGLDTLAEWLRPAVQTIADERRGKARQRSYYSPLMRGLSASNSDLKKALEIVEQGLKESPEDRALRLLKATLILRTAPKLELEEEEKTNDAKAKQEENAKQREAARAILESLSDEKKAFAPALLDLAEFYEDEDQSDDRKKAVALYQRYAAMISEDPRPWQRLALLQRGDNEVEPAISSYRAALERDSRNASRYTDLAEFLVILKRYDEAMKLLDEGAKFAGADEDLFANLFYRLVEHLEAAEGLASTQPQRMAKNATANVRLAYLLISENRAKEALPMLKKATEIDAKNVEARIGISDAYRQLKNWTAMLAATDEAIKLDAKSAEAYYNRACALARLGRKTEAIRALQKAIELDEEYLYDITDDEDLQLLAQMPAFKKLLKQIEDESKATTEQETIK